MTKEKILKEIQSYAKDKEALQRNVKNTYGYIPFDLLSTKQKLNIKLLLTHNTVSMYN